MKYHKNKGFTGIGVIITVIAALIIGGGIVYFATKTPTAPQNIVDNYPPVANNNNPPAQTEFISPTQGSTWSLGNSMAIEIKTSPQWFHCSNGFYLYDSSNQEIGTIGILTEPGKTIYNWPDTSKRYATCGTGVGEIPIAVPAGTYKICLKEQNTETGVGNNFYCSGLFTINALGSPVLTQSQAQILVHQTWSDCSQGDCGGVTVTVKQNSNGQYVVTAIFTELDDATSQTKRVSIATYQNGTWTLGQPTVTRMCHRGNVDGTTGWTSGLCI